MHQIFEAQKFGSIGKYVELLNKTSIIFMLVKLHSPGS